MIPQFNSITTQVELKMFCNEFCYPFHLSVPAPDFVVLNIIQTASSNRRARMYVTYVHTARPLSGVNNLHHPRARHTYPIDGTYSIHHKNAKDNDIVETPNNPFALEVTFQITFLKISTELIKYFQYTRKYVI